MERASKVLFEKGFHGTSIRDIAAACDMSMGQLYHYISSKDDILFLMHLYSQEQWHQHLAEGGFEQITDPVAKLEHGLRISMKYLSENRELYPVHLHREQVPGPGASAEGPGARRPERRRLLPAPALGDPRTARRRAARHELAANLVSFLCIFLPLRGWNLDLPDEAAVDAAVDFLVDFIFRGLGIERG